MTAPFYKFDLFNDEVSLIIAFIVGICFGFFLERAGFGSARKLAAQFYFRDMSVLKVMFTAIVTAMIGLFYLNWIGFIDLSLVYNGNTYLLPQIAGGLLLGIGFVVGGYCPGTSCVAVSTGRIDGIIYLLGVMAGIFFFGEIFPLLTGFFYSTNLGEITLPELLNLPFGLIVLLVVLMAIGAFAGAEWAEKKFGNKKA